MKAITAVCPTTGAVASGRVVRQHRRDVENEEIQMYLSKLKDLVPFMPKNRKLTKLEVIQNVIDYICDLQSALETHPVGSRLDAALRSSDTQMGLSGGNFHSHRQPLGVLPPSANTILTCNSETNNLLPQLTPVSLKFE